MSTIWFAHKVVCKTFAIKSETKLYVKKQMKSKKEREKTAMYVHAGIAASIGGKLEIK